MIRRRHVIGQELIDWRKRSLWFGYVLTLDTSSKRWTGKAAF